jgi:hypothetical protein
MFLLPPPGLYCWRERLGRTLRAMSEAPRAVSGG